MSIGFHYELYSASYNRAMEQDVLAPLERFVQLELGRPDFDLAALLHAVTTICIAAHASTTSSFLPESGPIVDALKATIDATYDEIFQHSKAEGTAE